ncbi:porin, partial [Klebsiella pneumoniae]|nr:porin [Klebsiella pneumoniae]
QFGGPPKAHADNFIQGPAVEPAPFGNSDLSGLVERLNFALQYHGKNEGQNAQDMNVGTNNRSNDSDARVDDGDCGGLSPPYGFGMG